MNIELIKNENETVLILPERIDSVNIGEVEKGVFGALEGQNTQNLVLDASNLKYISSVGLRMVLKLKKEYINIKIINVDHEVYEVFSMTGFTEMIEISKALKEVSIEGCPLIGQGAYGKVYRLSPDSIVKSFFRGNPVEDIEKERTLAKKAFVLGVPTAISYGVVKVKEEKYGAVYELINADSLLNVLQNDPANYEKYVQIYAHLLETINGIEVAEKDFPSYKKDLFERLETAKTLLNPDIFSKIHEIIDKLPDVNNLVHGDCHFKNIFISNNEPILIDMDTLARGPLIYDLAALFRTYIGYETVDPGNCLKFLGIEGEKCIKLFNDLFDAIYINKEKKEETYKLVEFLGFFMLLGHYALKIEKNKDKIDATLKILESKIKNLD